jgi:mRNA-degrading endonuclease RelE of RelBE toxin-antitoxin system
MEIEKTGEFDKDTKKLTAKDKERLDKVISEIVYSNKKGKQMHHLKDVFSIRFDNKRLVYQLIEKENKLILLMLKSREGVYEYLK